MIATCSGNVWLGSIVKWFIVSFNIRFQKRCGNPHRKQWYISESRILCSNVSVLLVIVETNAKIPKSAMFFNKTSVWDITGHIFKWRIRKKQKGCVVVLGCVWVGFFNAEKNPDSIKTETWHFLWVFPLYTLANTEYLLFGKWNLKSAAVKGLGFREL